MTSVRLRHIAQVNPATPAFDLLNSDDELTFLPMERVWPDERLNVTERRKKGVVASGYTRFQDGDVLVPKITPTFEAGRSVLIDGLHGGVGAGTTELHVLRPGAQVDRRFLLYIVSTHNFLKLGKAEMYGVAGQQRVPDDFLRNLRVSLPPLEEQRRIADFLDAETARIDALVKYRKRQADLVNERLGRALDDAFATCPSAAPSRFKFLMSSRPRYGVLVPHFEDEGVRFIRVNDLLDLAGRAGNLARIPRQLSQKYPRTATKAGDVLLSVVGTLGRAAVVPAELEGANIARAVASIRPRDGVPSHLVATWLSTLDFRRQAEEATGSDTAQATLGMEDLANFTLRWPVDSGEQDKLLRQVSDLQRAHWGAVSAMQAQQELLAEHRKALITAAVTGQFDVSSASGRGVTEGVPSA